MSDHVNLEIHLDGAWCPAADVRLLGPADESTRGATWPPFLVDLLPQGYGRQELLRQLGMPETAAASADWRLLLAGAGNPIGNLRVKEAADRLAGHAAHDRRGFTAAEVIERGEAFNEHLARHGLFVAGSSGVQGEWPKILLAENRDGLYCLDSVIDQTVEATGIDRAVLVRTLTGMLAPLRDLRRRALELGVDEAIMDLQRASIEGIVAQIEAL